MAERGRLEIYLANKIKLGHFGWYFLAIFLFICILGFFNTYLDPNANYFDFMIEIIDSIFLLLSVFNPVLELFTNFQFRVSYQEGKNLLILRTLANAAIVTLQISIISIIIGFVIAVGLAVILASPKSIIDRVAGIIFWGLIGVFVSLFFLNSMENTVVGNQLNEVLGRFLILVFIGLGFLSGGLLGNFIGLNKLAQGYVDFFRSTPLLVQILLIFIAIPQFVQSFGSIDFFLFSISLENFNFSPVNGGIVALALNTSAYQAEIIRGGILSIPVGQTEASLGLGLSRLQTMRYVILPQALRLIIPPFTNEGVNVILNSSLLSAISVLELTRKMRDLGAFYFTPFEIYATAAIFYFIMAFSLAKLTKNLESKYRIPGLGLTTE